MNTKKYLPEALITFSLSTVTLFITSVLDLAIYWSPTNYQTQIDVVVLSGIVILPVAFIVAVAGLYWKIRRIGDKQQ